MFVRSPQDKILPLTAPVQADCSVDVSNRESSRALNTRRAGREIAQSDRDTNTPQRSPPVYTSFLALYYEGISSIIQYKPTAGG